jgi:hypothetical protein
MKPQPIPLNPGGVLDPEDVVGRAEDANAVRESLEATSVVLTGERRMGKTSLARLLERDARERGWTVVRQSGEGYTDVAQFTEALIASIEKTSSALARAGQAIRERWGIQIGPLHIDPASGPRFLDDALATAVDAVDDRLLLVLDELPVLTRELERRQEGDGVALLHALRRLRQDHETKLRMLCLGSIGLHHVVRGGHGVLNDLTQHRLGPLDAENATYLAECLLLGIDVTADAEAIAHEVEGVPYYIHHLVASIRRSGWKTALGADEVAEFVSDAVADPNDPWDLRHYRDRIGPYFGEAAPLARAVLDAVAASAQGLAPSDIEARLAAHADLAPVDSDALRDVVERLEADHYLVRDGERRRFAFVLVRRAWLQNRT